MHRPSRATPIRAPWALVPLVAVACSFGDWADDTPRPFELHTIELDIEDDTRVMIGLDDDGAPLSTSALFTEGHVAAFRVEHEGDWLTVTAALDTGEVALRHDRDGWTYAWSSVDGEPLAIDVEERWSEITFAWRTALADRDRLVDGIGWAVNVVGEPQTVDADAWRRTCSTVVDWQCAAAPVTAALGCRVAGLGWCEATAR